MVLHTFHSHHMQNTKYLTPTLTHTFTSKVNLLVGHSVQLVLPVLFPYHPSGHSIGTVREALESIMILCSSHSNHIHNTKYLIPPHPPPPSVSLHRQSKLTNKIFSTVSIACAFAYHTSGHTVIPYYRRYNMRAPDRTNIPTPTMHKIPYPTPNPHLH